MKTLPIPPILFSFRLSNSSLSAWIWMLHTPVTSLLTSQATARPSWSIMLFGLWPFPSPLQLPVCMKRKKCLGFHCRECLVCRKKYIFFYILLKRIQDHVATLIIISIALLSLTSTSSMSLMYLLSNLENKV